MADYSGVTALIGVVIGGLITWGIAAWTERAQNKRFEREKKERKAKDRREELKKVYRVMLRSVEDYLRLLCMKESEPVSDELVEEMVDRTLWARIDVMLMGSPKVYSICAELSKVANGANGPDVSKKESVIDLRNRLLAAMKEDISTLSKSSTAKSGRSASFRV